MSTSSSFLLADVDQDLANCRYVERLEMGGLDIHIINLIVMGEAWVTSQDIATLVSDWQGRDILAPMLARKKVELDIMMVSSFTHPDLVQRLVEEGVKGVSREVDQLMLYRLVNVPGILNLFMVTMDRQRMLLSPLQSSSLTQSASSGLGSSDSRFSFVYVKEYVDSLI